MKTDRITVDGSTITIDDGEFFKLSADVSLAADIITNGTSAEPIIFYPISFNCDCNECDVSLYIYDSGTIELVDNDIRVYGWIKPSQAAAIYLAKAARNEMS